MGSPCLLSDQLRLASGDFLLISRPLPIEVICLKQFLWYRIFCPRKDMAANYWTSSQRRCWQFSRQALSDIREQLESGEQNLIQQYPLPDRRLLSLFFNQRMLSVPLCFEDKIENLTMDVRDCKACQAAADPTASHCDCTSVYAKVLHQSSSTENKPVHRDGHCSVPSLQDGRVPAAYTHRPRRGSRDLVRFESSLHSLSFLGLTIGKTS